MTRLWLILLLIVIGCRGEIKQQKKFAFSFGERAVLMLPDYSSIDVIISKQNVINGHNFYLVRDSKNKQIEVSEEELGKYELDTSLVITNGTIDTVIQSVPLPPGVTKKSK